MIYVDVSLKIKKKHLVCEKDYIEKTLNIQGVLLTIQPLQVMKLRKLQKPFQQKLFQ